MMISKLMVTSVYGMDALETKLQGMDSIMVVETGNLESISAILFWLPFLCLITR